MFKSLSSRSTRSVSVSSSNSLASTSTSTTTATTPTLTAFIPTVLPPIPPTPTRETPAICVVAPTPGGPTSSPILEKRRTRTLVPRRAALGKENGHLDETPRAGSLRARPLRPVPAPAPMEPADPTTLVAQQFVASQNHRHRQFHTAGPSSGISFVPAPRNPSPPSRQGSLRTGSKMSKRVLVETRAYPNGGQVEVVKETIGRSSKPLSRIGSEVLGSLRGGTITGGSTRLARNSSTKILADSVRDNLADENGGTALVVKKKKSRATLDSIRWALGDRTNAARKAEKEKEKADKAVDKERRSQDSGAERPKTMLTIDTRLPPAPVGEASTTSTILSPMTDTPATTVADSTDGEGVPQSATGEKSKWRWTIGRKRTKSPGPSLSSTSDRRTHSRSSSLDLEALLAATHAEAPTDKSEAFSNSGPHPASANLPTLMYNAVADAQVEAPLPSSRPLPVETAPVDFGCEPKTVRKTSTGSAETQTSSGTTRRSSIGNIFTSSGENASNTGSFALRAMRSVRSIASIARISGWGKGEDGDKEKEATVKEKKKKHRKRMPIMEVEPTSPSDENEPTTRIASLVGQPSQPGSQVVDEREDAGTLREHEGRGRVSEDCQSFGSSPSTVSYGRTPRSRMSNASSGSSEYAASSTTHRSQSSRAPSMRISPRHSAPIDDGGLFSSDNGSPVSTTANGSIRQAGPNTSRRGPKGLMGIFDPLPPPSEPSPPHVEVRGVKVNKGSVRDRVRQFEARAEEHATTSQFGSVRGGSVARRALSLGAIAALATNDEESYAQERSYALSMGRSSSVPLLSSESPNRPTQPRPLSEQLLRPRDPAALSILNAANSDLSDLISRLDLSTTPDSKHHLSPDASRRLPTWVDESPLKRPSGHREPKSSITSLKGYDHPSIRPHSMASSSSLTEEEEAQLEFGSAIEMKLHGTAKASLVVLPGASSARTQRPRPRVSKGSIGAATRLSVASTLDTVCESPGRVPPEARRHTSFRNALVEDSMFAETGPDSDIPDELQVILAGQSEDEGAMPSPDLLSPSLPSNPRGVQHHSRVHFDVNAEYSDGTEGGGSEGEEVSSRRSFDFTGELGQLKGGSRNSFVEALVTAFTAPPVPGASEGHLQLNFDTLNEPPSGMYSGDDVAPDEMVDAYEAGGRTPTFARMPMNKKSNGQLNLEFSFSDPQPSRAPAISQAGPATRPAASRGRQVTFEVEFEQPSQNDRGQPMSSKHNSLAPVASDPFGAHQSQSWIQSDDTTRSLEKARQESMASIPSMSSLGQVINGNQEDTFDYENLMRELDAVSSSIDGSTHALERSAARRRHHRLSTDSDRSSLRARRNSRREDTLMSLAFGAPPVSFHNRPYGRQLGHNQNVSIEQLEREDTGPHMTRPGLGDKMFQTHAEHGMPLPSIIASPANSDASEPQDTFGNYANRRFSYMSDRRQSYISERRNSYAPSVTDQHRMSFVSYDSMLDVPRDSRRTSIDGDSMFERRGRPSSIGSISVFGDDKRRRRRSRAVYNPSQFRPVSIISMQSETTAEDDTMVSMIGGGDNSRVPRKSIATTLLFDTSPCMRAEKRARDLASAQFIEANRAASLSALTGQPIRPSPQQGSSRDSILEYSPSKGRSCLPSRPFARPRPPATAQSAVDESDMEEMDLTSDQTPMLSMPNRSFTSSRNSLTGDHTSSSRRRGSLICTAEPPDTPPLSDTGSDGSGGSQSSIDVSKLSGVPHSSSAPPNAPPSGHRARPRGQGHRLRSPRSSLASRSSLSIAEADLPRGATAYLNRSNSDISVSISDSVIIVNPDVQMAEMIEMISAGYPLSDEHMTLVTRYCALRNEAMETVARSQIIWQDTDFSRFALSTFSPPTNPSEIKAMIDHSQDAFNQLPIELYKRARPRHSRNYPRSSPYPADVSRYSIKSSISPRARLATESVENVLSLLPPMYNLASPSPRPVRESPIVSQMGYSLVNPVSSSPALSTVAPLSSVAINYRPSPVVEEKSLKQGIRPRVPSAARRTALGWGRKKSVEDASTNPVKGKGKAISTVAPTAAKENEGAGLMSASNNSLRFNRPRPKARVASASSRPTTLRV